MPVATRLAAGPGPGRSGGDTVLSSYCAFTHRVAAASVSFGWNLKGDVLVLLLLGVRVGVCVDTPCPAPVKTDEGF